MVSSLRQVNRADVVFSTVDTVGIPLMLLARSHVARSPFVYTAIGLPERLARLGPGAMERLYAQALAAASALVTYSRHEADVLAGWLSERGTDVPVEFVPFGVDVEAFRPTTAEPNVDVVSIGADPHRDFELLLTVARSLAETRFLVVTTAERLRSFDGLPGNVSVETELPFDEMRGGSSAREPSRCPCARTATRARRQSFSRRWRSGSRSLSRGRRRSPRATGSRTVTTCGLSRLGMPPDSGGRSPTCWETTKGRARSVCAPARR